MREKQKSIDESYYFYGIRKGPFKYCVSTFWRFEPHLTSNQTLLIKLANFMLLHNHLAHTTHTPLITYYLNGPLFDQKLSFNMHLTSTSIKR